MGIDRPPLFLARKELMFKAWVEVEKHIAQFNESRLQVALRSLALFAPAVAYCLVGLDDSTRCVPLAILAFCWCLLAEVDYRYYAVLIDVSVEEAKALESQLGFISLSTKLKNRFDGAKEAPLWKRLLVEFRRWSLRGGGVSPWSTMYHVPTVAINAYVLTSMLHFAHAHSVFF